MEFPDEDNAECLRKKLAVAVRSIQWSYAIFWRLSATQQGVLEWGEGYYNGDIKTRKPVHSEDTDAQNLGLQRSEQLRELYQSLLDGESEVGKERESGACLSPDDLSNLEWYYLVCMSFGFKFGQSLPGKALATGQHIWLLDAQFADSKVFSRSLLAKSASVQTVICFPHKGGVIELGIIDSVPEDLDVIQHIKTTLLEVMKPVCSEKLSDSSYDDDEDYCTGIKVIEGGNEIGKLHFSSVYASREEYVKFDEDFHLTDDDIGQGNTKLSPKMNDTCHRRTLSAIREGRNISITDQSSSVCVSRSSFLPWKKDFIPHCSTTHASQKILKTILPRASSVQACCNSKRLRTEGNRVYPSKPQARHLNISCYAITQKDNRRFCKSGGKTDTEQYLALKSLLPSNTKTDETSILTDTIKYLKELKARADELESCIDFKGSSAMRDSDVLEHTSDDNYESVEFEKKPFINKRKVSEITNFQPLDVKVNVVENEVHIKMKCPWRENLLVDIIEVVNNLNLDTHTVQSSALNGILSLFLKSKNQGEEFASEGTIKQALQSMMVDTC